MSFQNNSCQPIVKIGIYRTILVQSLKSVFRGQFLSNLSILYFQENSCPISQICISRTILVQVQSLNSIFLGQFMSNLSNLYFQNNSCPSQISQFYISRTILVQSPKSVCLGQFLSKSNLSILYFQGFSTTTGFLYL